MTYVIEYFDGHWYKCEKFKTEEEALDYLNLWDDGEITRIRVENDDEPAKLVLPKPF